MNKKTLKIFRDILTGSKERYLTVKGIQRIMATGEPMPTTIFRAKRKQYIVPDRDIYAKKRKRDKGRFSF